MTNDSWLKCINFSDPMGMTYIILPLHHATDFYRMCTKFESITVFKKNPGTFGKCEGSKGYKSWVVGRDRKVINYFIRVVSVYRPNVRGKPSTTTLKWTAPKMMYSYLKFCANLQHFTGLYRGDRTRFWSSQSVALG